MYVGNGCENAYGSSEQASTTGAFDAWKNSPGDNAVILETGIWAGMIFLLWGLGFMNIIPARAQYIRLLDYP